MTLPAHLRSQWRRCVLGASLLISGGSCLGESAATGNGLHIHGFGSVGVVNADVPSGWTFQRDTGLSARGGGTRFDVDSRFGLQMNYAVSQQFELVGQLVASRRSLRSHDSELVQWAFAAYRPTPDLTLRAGRVNMDLFLMSGYRNVGFAYLFAGPPAGFYGSLPTSLDGADITKAWDDNGIQWRAKAFVGRTQGNGTVLNPVVGVSLSRQSDGLTLRAGLTRLVVPDPPTTLQPLIDGLSRLQGLPVPRVAAEAAALSERLNFSGSANIYAALGASYERDDWSLSAEVTRISGHPSLKFYAGYISLGKRIGAWTVYGLASRSTSPAESVEAPDWEATLTPRLGAAVAKEIQLLGSSAASAASRISGNRQRTYTIGARWDIHPRLALKLQYDNIRIYRNSGRLWTNASLDPGRVDLTSLVLDFVF